MVDLKNKDSMYRIYKKKKPNGKFRVIHAPQGVLKEEQEKLAKKLGVIYDPPECVYGYVSGRSPADLAKKHAGKDWIITIDIKDFFPSITKIKLMSFLTEYEAEIATYKNRCVQGSPSSPIISNMVLEKTDRQMNAIFGTIHGVCYTRYSDDIQLSGYGDPRWRYIQLIKNVLLIDGFKINESKIRFMFKNQRQEVLGICVNDKPSTDRKRRSQLKFRARRGMLTESDRGYMAYTHGVMNK